MDEFDFKLKARRELYDLSTKDLNLLCMIMNNIKENPEEPKYRRIKSRKLNDQIYSLMAMTGFIKKVYDFENHAILEDTNDMKSVVIMSRLIEESQNSRERKKKEQLLITEQLKKEKEKKKEIQEKLKLDYLERVADKERMKLIRGSILIHSP